MARPCVAANDSARLLQFTCAMFLGLVVVGFGAQHRAAKALKETPKIQIPRAQ
jgi:hypothetical protein